MPVRCIVVRHNNTAGDTKAKGGISFKSPFFSSYIYVTYEPVDFMISRMGVPKKFRLII